jgi:hypothetical protein
MATRLAPTKRTKRISIHHASSEVVDSIVTPRPHICNFLFYDAVIYFDYLLRLALYAAYSVADLLYSCRPDELMN